MLGAAVTLTKPIMPELLLGAVERVLGERSGG